MGTTPCLNKQEYDAPGLRLLKTTWFSWDGDRLAGEVCHDETLPPTAGEARTWLTAPDNEWTAQGYLYRPGTFEPLAVQLYQAEPGAQPLRRAGRLIRSDEAHKARLKADTLCFYQNDPNGMPLRLWSTTGEMVWSAHYSVSGQAQVSASSRVWQPLRLQGQYFDAESGLHYNRFRYYDPRAGMFISQDPIGLLGGINPYQFAVNILTWLDPLGLNSWNRFQQANAGTSLSRAVIADLYTASGQKKTKCASSSSGSNGETEDTKRGREAHKNYKYALGDSYDTEVTLPNGTRADAIDWVNNVVRELKPDNPRAIHEGEKQLMGYVEELEKLTGDIWNSYLDTYRK